MITWSSFFLKTEILLPGTVPTFESWHWALATILRERESGRPASSSCFDEGKVSLQAGLLHRLLCLLDGLGAVHCDHLEQTVDVFKDLKSQNI